MAMSVEDMGPSNGSCLGLLRPKTLRRPPRRVGRGRRAERAGDDRGQHATLAPRAAHRSTAASLRTVRTVESTVLAAAGGLCAYGVSLRLLRELREAADALVDVDCRGPTTRAQRLGDGTRPPSRRAAGEPLTTKLGHGIARDCQSGDGCAQLLVRAPATLAAGGDGAVRDAGPRRGCANASISPRPRPGPPGPGQAGATLFQLRPRYRQFGACMIWSLSAAARTGAAPLKKERGGGGCWGSEGRRGRPGETVASARNTRARATGSAGPVESVDSARRHVSPPPLGAAACSSRCVDAHADAAAKRARASS